MKTFEEISDRIEKLIDWHAINLNDYTFRRGAKKFTSASEHTADQKRYLAEITDLSYEINKFAIEEFLESEEFEESELNTLKGLLDKPIANIFRPAYKIIKPLLTKTSDGTYKIKECKEKILANYKYNFNPNNESVLDNMLELMDRFANDYVSSSQV